MREGKGEERPAKKKLAKTLCFGTDDILWLLSNISIFYSFLLFLHPFVPTMDAGGVDGGWESTTAPSCAIFAKPCQLLLVQSNQTD